MDRFLTGGVGRSPAAGFCRTTLEPRFCALSSVSAFTRAVTPRRPSRSPAAEARVAPSLAVISPLSLASDFSVRSSNHLASAGVRCQGDIGLFSRGARDLPCSPSIAESGGCANPFERTFGRRTENVSLHSVQARSHLLVLFPFFVILLLPGEKEDDEEGE